MQVTFLESSNGLRLSKSFLSSGVQSYPHVKDVVSHEYSIDSNKEGLTSFLELIRQHGEQGHCLLKGNLKEKLNKQSRKGKTDRTAYTELLVLDLDGVSLPSGLGRKTGLTAEKLELLSEQLISQLPIAFRDISYIVQASSSFGMKEDKISLHMFFLLTVPLPPKTLKLWLQHTNYTTPLFKDQIKLSANGQSLKCPLDISLADNSKLIFIAPPYFENNQENPFVNNGERVVEIRRTQASIDLATQMYNISPEVTYELGQSIKNDLRSAAGLKKKAAKTQTLTINQSTKEVLVNPDRMAITVVDTESTPYIRCNINNGDSAAYYFNLERPTYMYNFKDEPIFEIEKADPDFYKSIFDLFSTELNKVSKGTYPLVLRDYYTNIYYNGIFDPELNQFSERFPLIPTTKTSIASFMLSHARAAPDYVPDATVIFDPTSNSPQINMSKIPYHVNIFQRTPYMLNPTNPKQPLEFGYAKNLMLICPAIYKLIDHILGNGEEELERFINWLAYIFQTRKKTSTSWVLSGVQGTGKGLFHRTVIKPLFGEEQAQMRTLEALEEQFNLYMRDALFLMVDEFHMGSARHGIGKIADKLKNWITEETVSIRAMHSNSMQMKNFTNFMFFTNRHDAMKIDPGDRRYNIAPRQEVKILDKYPELPDQLNNMKEELFIFAGILNTFKYEEQFIRVPIDNTAKEQMRIVSMSMFEEFCQAIKEGNLESFIDVLDINTTSIINAGEIQLAQRHVKSWIAAAKKSGFSFVPIEHLRIVFHIQTERQPRLSAKEFSKELSQYGVNKTRGRPHKSRAVRGVKIEWKIKVSELDDMINTYLEDEDMVLLHGE